MYNLANYIKFIFYKGTIDYDVVDLIIKNVSNEYEAIFLFSNLLYPNFYFNIIEEIINWVWDESDEVICFTYKIDLKM